MLQQVGPGDAQEIASRVMGKLQSVSPAILIETVLSLSTALVEATSESPDQETFYTAILALSEEFLNEQMTNEGEGLFPDPEPHMELKQ